MVTEDSIGRVEFEAWKKSVSDKLDANSAKMDIVLAQLNKWSGIREMLTALVMVISAVSGIAGFFIHYFSSLGVPDRH
jgi:hypothetical protein